MASLVRVATFAVLAVFAWSATSEACSCVGPQPTCRAFWRMDAVFTGEVISIADVSRPLDAAGRTIQERLKRVRLRVIEAFNGISAAEVDVETGVGGGDCGYGFSVGATYVVFANGRNGILSTGICSNTKPLSAAAADLEFLRGLNGPAPTRARIYGKVISWDYNVNGGEPRPRLPFNGARLIATDRRRGTIRINEHARRVL